MTIEGKSGDVIKINLLGNINVCTKTLQRYFSVDQSWDPTDWDWHPRSDASSLAKNGLIGQKRLRNSARPCNNNKNVFWNVLFIKGLCWKFFYLKMRVFVPYFQAILQRNDPATCHLTLTRVKVSEKRHRGIFWSSAAWQSLRGTRLRAELS